MNIQQVYDSLPIGVCVLRRDRRKMDILYINPAMATIMGRTPIDLLGMGFAQVWPHDEAASLIQGLKAPAPPKSVVLPAFEWSSGRHRWIKIDITRDNWENADCYILWATDISASKQAEEQLQAAVEEADATAELKSNFLATMSHEIRTPMQTIYGLLELIDEEKPDARIKSMVGTARNAASGLLEILDDILDIAKMDANKMELDVFELPVRTLVRGILEALSVKVHGISIAMVDDIEQDVPFVIIGDPKRLRQILMNLIGNALKFTHEGSVRVHVTRQTQHLPRNDHGLNLRFEIIDSGIGMSRATCEKLFSSFAQADSSTSRKYGGTGLGLSISRKLVELMGGVIGVESTEGKGSTFWFEIPTEEVGVHANTLELPKLDGISVLSVEDHPQGSKEIANSLQSMGATVESCANYTEALDLIRRRPFDVGVFDQGLPDGLGYDLIKEAMYIRPYMGLVMYTVRDDIGLQHSLHALGVPYLTKPAGRVGLGEAVRNAARRNVRVSIDGPTRLLIAEDTESVRDVLRRQLEKLGVDADFVINGNEALSALATGKYGILFSDLHMPDMDGYTLAQNIREEEAIGGNKRLPIIVLTADVQMAQRETYQRHGFDECLLKPVSLGQFRRLLIRWGLLNEQASIEEPALPVQASRALAPAIDKEGLKEQMGAFDDDAIDMLQMFVEMTEPLIQKISDAATHTDWHGLKESAHSLKGAARSACCNRLGDIAATLQDDAEKKKPSAGLVAQIIEEFGRVKLEVKALKD